MKNNIIVPVGYMGSGSSAITHLVSEFKGYEAKAGIFEFVFLHCPNGLFDLEDKLLVGNTTLRSDEALHSFYNTMKMLYDKKYWWVGHYKEIIGEDFWPVTQNFIESLIQCKPDYFWYPQENVNTRMFFKLILNKLVSIATFKKIHLKKPLLYPEIWLSYVKPDEFYEKAKAYLNQIFDMLGVEKNHIILDQLLLPQNMHRIDHYFDSNLKAFVVQRDPRDVFIINKYIWPAQNEIVPFSTEVEDFCRQYRLMREAERRTDSKKVIYLKFEDLVYNYDESIKAILNFLDLSPADHIRKKEKFKPEISINNTQLFRANPSYKREAEIIENMLPEYLYCFPYENHVNTETIF
ncbi:sulfotransferase [Paludicola sp. MB14-C6]|uniref:sulfotransferase n=1 Tax=Paludihabitans sp. MB14-C6 TaxID=3070656 RepID=UPI0027DE2F50|nr:sulfotransferase [Paludicola sp. MB14-C6]WMJ22633.1 sulfotransferase [Paludicola sp. MB14-C6]